MSLSPTELAAVVQELALLVGARVQKVYAPGPRQLVLELRMPGRTHTLLLDTEPAVARLGLVAQRPPSPERALPLQSVWRTQLTGARLDRVEADAARRLARLFLATDGGPRQLVAEVLPKGGDLLLLDGHEHLVAGLLSDRTRERGNARGQPYRPPEPVAEPTARTRLPALEGEFPVSQAIAQLYGQITQTRSLTRARGEVLGPLRQARKKTARTLEKIRADRARIEEAQRYQRLGDLLKPHLGKLKRGAAEAKVVDYGPEGMQEVAVPLLPHLSAKENMERYYHLHRRLSRSAGRVDERLEQVARQLARLEALLQRGEAAEDEAQVEEVLEAARREGLWRVQEQAEGHAPGEAPRVPYREFRSGKGLPIWVGRNARDNDVLTLKYARGNDLWLHARGQTGSHVIVPGVGSEGPDGETLLDAATLAVHFSAARHEGLCEVAATRRKYVQKPKGAAPGSVRFSQERTIPLRMEPGRLARLLATEGGGGGAREGEG